MNEHDGVTTPGLSSTSTAAATLPSFFAKQGPLLVAEAESGKSARELGQGGREAASILRDGESVSTPAGRAAGAGPAGRAFVLAIAHAGRSVSVFGSGEQVMGSRYKDEAAGAPGRKVVR